MRRGFEMQGEAAHWRKRPAWLRPELPHRGKLSLHRFISR